MSADVVISFFIHFLDYKKDVKFLILRPKNGSIKPKTAKCRGGGRSYKRGLIHAIIVC